MHVRKTSLDVPGEGVRVQRLGKMYLTIMTSWILNKFIAYAILAFGLGQFFIHAFIHFVTFLSWLQSIPGKHCRNTQAGARASNPSLISLSGIYNQIFSDIKLKSMWCSKWCCHLTVLVSSVQSWAEVTVYVKFCSWFPPHSLVSSNRPVDQIVMLHCPSCECVCKCTVCVLWHPIWGIFPPHSQCCWIHHDLD